MEIEPEFVLNYELLRAGNTDYITRLGKKEYIWNMQGLLIWDECQRCKSYSSLNSAMMIAAWKSKVIRCLLLSATATESPVDMRAIGYVLGLHHNYDFWQWLFVNGAKRDRFGGVEWRGSREQLEQIHKKLYPDRGVRVRIKDLGDLFPENQIIAEAYDLGDEGELEKAYAEAYKELQELKKKQKYDYPSAFTIILRARQKAELLKVPLLIEQTQDLLAEGKSVVIFINFNATLDLLMVGLETECVVRGEQGDERQKNIDDFNADKERVIICNLQSGGTGLSLHDLHGDFPRVSLITPSYNAIDLKQALGRIHRAKGKSPCLQKIIYGNNSVEQKVMESVRRKTNNIDLINDGDISDGLQLNE